jgi:hypothetical protein
MVGITLINNIAKLQWTLHAAVKRMRASLQWLFLGTHIPRSIHPVLRTKGKKQKRELVINYNNVTCANSKVDNNQTGQDKTPPWTNGNTGHEMTI